VAGLNYVYYIKPPLIAKLCEEKHAIDQYNWSCYYYIKREEEYGTERFHLSLKAQREITGADRQY